jgi:hypothetical protein
VIRIPLLACAIFACAAAHAEVGIGVSAKSSDATVYVPIKVAKFMFEPYVRYTDRESEGFNIGSTTARSGSELEAYTVGVGIFRARELSERVTLYYGGRLAAITEESRSVSVTTTSFPIALPPALQSTEVDGHSIAPTVGFQYHFMERLSIGAEVGVEHAELDATTIDDPLLGTTRTFNSDLSGNDTRSNVIVRFYF